MQVTLKHGLLDNPQGQGIVERTHRTLKECLAKQKVGIGAGCTPRERISLALFTLNFLQLDAAGRSAAERHTNWTPTRKGYVKWKDILTGTWNGPDPVLTWARGSVCVFLQDKDDPVWVPERLVRKCNMAGSPAPVHEDAASEDGREMGDLVGVPESAACPS